MNLQQLEYLVALDTHRQFGLAAEKCFVTQPALSMQVQKLEDELGVRLFERNRRGVVPTGTGAKVIDQARQALRSIQQLREVVNLEKGEMVGELRLGVIPTLAPYLLPLILGELAQAYPGLRIRIDELQTEHLMERLRDHRLDVGLLVTPLDDSQLREIPIIDEPFLAYVSPEHPLFGQETIKPSDMTIDNLWLLQQGHCFRSQVLNICGTSAAAAERPFTYESGSIETLKQLVRHNQGYTLVPELSVLDEIGTNPMLKRFEAPEPVREVSLVVHNTFVRLPLLAFLRDALLRHVPTRLHAGKATQKIRWQ